MSETQWFVEGDARDNENIARFLTEHSLGENASMHLKDEFGKFHDVWLVPSSMLSKFRAAKRVNDVFKFRFWVRNTNYGPIRRADFIETRRASLHVKRALANLEEVKKRKQTRSS